MKEEREQRGLNDSFKKRNRTNYNNVNTDTNMRTRYMSVYIPHVLRNTLGNSTPTRTLTLYYTECVRYHTTRKVTHPLGGRTSKLPPPPPTTGTAAVQTPSHVSVERCRQYLSKVAVFAAVNSVLRSVGRKSALQLFPSIGLCRLPCYTTARYAGGILHVFSEDALSSPRITNNT